MQEKSQTHAKIRRSAIMYALIGGISVPLVIGVLSAGITLSVSGSFVRIAAALLEGIIAFGLGSAIASWLMRKRCDIEQAKTVVRLATLYSVLVNVMVFGVFFHLFRYALMRPFIDTITSVDEAYFEALFTLGGHFLVYIVAGAIAFYVVGRSLLRQRTEVSAKLQG